MRVTSIVPVKKPARSELPIRREPPDVRNLLERILDTPHLEQVVPRLKPEVLHRVIETCGLEDCADLVALATPDQLQAVFDLDLWRPPRPGVDEQLDPDRFGQWLEVLMASGAAVAAQKLMGVDLHLVIAALAQHLRVRDVAAASPYTTLDGELIDPKRRAGGGIESEIGGYQVEAKRADAWDSIVELLLFLDAEHGEFFRRVMGGCRKLSNSRPELDGFHHLMTDNDQDMFDLAVGRDERREQQGYVTPAQARAFLQAARELPLGQSDGPPLSPVAQAYFRAMESTDQSGADAPEPPSPASDSSGTAADALFDVLLDAGVLPAPARALLTGGPEDTRRLSVLQTLMQYANEHDAIVFSSRGGELAYLANTLVAGCSVQGRPFTASEASDAAAAICNLGLENWPKHWPVGAGAATLPEDFLVDHDLISAFQIGWRVLHVDVCLFAAGRLIRILTDSRHGDPDIQSGLNVLFKAMSREWRAGTPWRARHALDVIATLDLPAWAALLALFDECPVIHAALGASQRAGVRSISPTAFEFISTDQQIRAVGEFMDALPDLLAR